MTAWLLIGSSPNAKRALAEVQHRFKAVEFTTITTNAGIRLVPRPTWYLLHDPRAATMFVQHWRLAQTQGTQVIRSVLHHSPQHRQLMRRVVPTAHTELATFASERPRYQRGRSISPACSGAICAQFAVHRGCTHLVMVGMDGYRSRRGRICVETFDGRRGHRFQGQRTMDRYGPLMASMCRRRPDVQFTWVGRPIYHGLLSQCRNVRIIPVQGARADARSTPPATTRCR